jgi:hypothetical protein
MRHDLSVYDIAPLINSPIFSKKQLGCYSRQNSRSNEPRIIKCAFDQLAVNCTTNTQVPIRDGTLFTIACGSNIWHFHTPFLYVLGGVNLDTVALSCRYSYLSMSRISIVEPFLHITCDNWYRPTVKTLHSSRMLRRTVRWIGAYLRLCAGISHGKVQKTFRVCLLFSENKMYRMTSL